MCIKNSKLQSVAIFAVLSLVEVGIALLDIATAREFALSYLYLVPIMVGAWYGGRICGVGIAIFSVVEWFILAGKLVPNADASTIIVGTLIRFVIYVPLAVIVARLRKALIHEKKLARTDALTGAANSRTFHEQTELEVRRASRSSQPLTIAYVDLDNFKDINDQFGHLVGDKVLRIVVDVMRRSIRATDIVARLGGDEFALLLPDTGFDGARTILRKLHVTIQAEMDRRGWPITSSIGAVSFLAPPADVALLIQEADKRLYIAKEKGKNRVEHELISETM